MLEVRNTLILVPTLLYCRKVTGLACEVDNGTGPASASSCALFEIPFLSTEVSLALGFGCTMAVAAAGRARQGAGPDDYVLVTWKSACTS